MIVRERVDGVLGEVLSLPREAAKPLVARLKLMADMEIGERRVPQDGRIIIEHSGREYDFRVTTLPAMYGESAVIRIFDQSSILVGLDKIGLSPEVRDAFERKLAEPQGWIIVTGPAGAGKTTTLYSGLDLINRPTSKLVAVEDPVIYRMRGVTQMHVNRRMGLTFAAAMRYFQRSDPDVIVVGAIEDLATAEACMQASVTGHMVLTTMLPPDAPSVIMRLIEMGGEPFMISASLTAVVAQRLARRLCSACRMPYRPAPDVLERVESLSGMDLSGAAFYRPVGCSKCNPYGYKGRTGLYELLEMNERLRELTVRRASTAELRQAAVESGMVTMLQDGLRKAQDGITSLEEVMRVLATDRAI